MLHDNPRPKGITPKNGVQFSMSETGKFTAETNWIRWLFGIAAVYDGALGLVFIFAAERVFAMFDVTPPNHYGYVQFPAFLLMVFAGMFAQIAASPMRRREWMPFGAGLKAAYSGVVFYHVLFGRIPSVWVPFAYADAVFLALFLLAWWKTKPTEARR